MHIIAFVHVPQREEQITKVEPEVANRKFEEIFPKVVVSEIREGNYHLVLVPKGGNDCGNVLGEPEVGEI